MAKKIKLSNQDIDKLVEEFKLNLQNSKCLSHEVKYTFHTEKMDTKVKIIFSEEAYVKIKALVADFNTEVQWQGFVERIDETTFLIKDIVVPPHEVTGTTVVSDSEEYNLFIDDLGDKINEMRFHGHSHVNMHVSPSSVDMEYRRNVVNNCSPFFDNYFYIFIIVNKKGDVSGQVYDMENNVLYETDDIIFEKELGEYNLELFLEDAHRLATQPEPKTNLPFQNEAKEEKKKEEKKEEKVKYPTKTSNYHIDGYDDYGHSDFAYNDAQKYYDALYH